MPRPRLNWMRRSAEARRPEAESSPAFALSLGERGFSYVYPPSTYAPGALASALATSDAVAEHRIEDTRDGSQRLTVTFAGSAAVDSRIAQLFARVNRHPFYDPARVAGFRNSRRPLVSCVILLTANDRFVHRMLVPSIVASSRGHPIEIIVVYNGVECDTALFRHLRVVRSPFGWVAKAYNKGVSKARGEIVAIFHDDCIMNDPAWIDGARQLLDGGTLAVTPEIQMLPGLGLRVARNVPLVMYKRRFEATGGYDEGYFAGMEDIDFTYKLLSSRATVSPLDVDHYHFEGMSTTILMSPDGRTLKALYGLNMLPKSAVLSLKHRLFEQKAAEIGLVTASNMKRFMDKFEAFLISEGLTEALSHGRRLSALARSRRSHPLLRSRRALVDLYRAHLRRRWLVG